MQVCILVSFFLTLSALYKTDTTALLVGLPTVMKAVAPDATPQAKHQMSVSACMPRKTLSWKLAVSVSEMVRPCTAIRA